MDKIILHRYNTFYLKTARIATATSLTLSFTNTDYFNVTLSANASMTLTGVPVGKIVYAMIFNSHATDTIGITLPTSIGDPSPAYIPAQKYVRFTIFNDGTNIVITYSGVLD